MGKKSIEIRDHNDAAKKLAKDVGNNNIRLFDVPSFERNYHFTNYPNDYLSKCSGVTVAISSSDDTNWMAIAPYRVDFSGSTSEKVYDIDPMIITLASDNENASPTAYIGYHQKYDNRQIDIQGFAHLSKEDTVTTIRNQYCTGSLEYKNAPKEIESALQYMAKLFRQKTT